MRTHFAVLVVGSLTFLAIVISLSWERTVGGSDPAAIAAKNIATIVELLGLFGMYAVFVVLVLGHGLLRQRIEQSHAAEERVESD